MQYRRIQDLEEMMPTSGTPSGYHDPSTSPNVLHNPRKRKLSNAFDQIWQQDRGSSKDWENDREDDIHLFRRVHIRARKGVEWSQTNKSPFLIVHSSAPNSVNLVPDRLWSKGLKAAAVHANRPFDRRFCYFEISIENSGFSNDGDGDG